jgi:peptidyl-prolyl cis-trans isomerase A (cyclophilin A)
MRSILYATAFVVLMSSLALAQEKSAPAGADKPKTETKKEGKMNPVVIMKTSMGTIKIELFEAEAPVTVKNFLSYVDDKYFDNTVFHRVIKKFMNQGGGFEAGNPIKQKTTKAPIVNESANGLKNDRGTICMARTNDPNSATSQFFINVVDNLSLNRNGGNAGYAVFGKVVEGMDVLDKINDVPTQNAKAIARNGDKEIETMFQDVPVKPVVVESVRRATAKK